LDNTAAAITELLEAHLGEEGAFSELEKINKGTVNKRLKEIKHNAEYADEAMVLEQWVALEKQQAAVRKQMREAETALDQLVYEKYSALNEKEIKQLVVDDKWMATLESTIQGELEKVSQTLTTRIRELAERYENPLPQLIDNVETLSASVDKHLEQMGLVWK